MILSLSAAFSGGALVTSAWWMLRDSMREGAQGSVLRPPAKEAADDGPEPPLPSDWTRFAGARPELRGWPQDSALAVWGLRKQPPEVLRALFDVAERLGVPVDTLATVIAHESGWKPNALYFRDKNDDGTPRKVPFVAAGICQLTVAAHLEGFNTWQKVREVSSWPVERQLQEVVFPLWSKYGSRLHGAHPGLGLMLNFLPDKAGKPESLVLGEKGAKGFSGRVFAMNPGLDVDKDGKITIGDVYASAARACRGAKGQRVRANGSLWSPPKGPQASVVHAQAARVAPVVKSTAEPPKAAQTATTTKQEPAPTAPAEQAKTEQTRIEPAATSEQSASSRSMKLTDKAGGLLIAAIRANREEPPIWTDVLWEGRGKTQGIHLKLRVSAHAVRAPVEIEGLGKRLLRLPISYQEHIEVCRLRRWLPLTQSMSDAIWTAARRINPPLLGKWKTPEESADSSRRMGTLEWVVQFNERLDRQIPEESWHRLWATEGKDWILHPRIAERTDGKGAINYGLHRHTGIPWQPPGGKHDWTHSDYSQTLRAMEWEATDVDTGKKVAIIDVLRKAGLPASILAPFEGIS